MLAEKFFLVLETLMKSRQYSDGGCPRVKSSSPHVPIEVKTERTETPTVAAR